MLSVHAATLWTDASVQAAIGEGIALLMVHEQRDGKGAVPFGRIIADTPPPLRHVYDGQLASPLYDGDERVCLRVFPSRENGRVLASCVCL